MSSFKPDSTVLIQGIATPLGTACAAALRAYGTQVVAGVSPGNGGSKLAGFPTFDLVQQAVEVGGGIDISLICVHPYMALDAALEAMAAGIRQIIVLSEGVPPLDAVRLVRQAEITDTSLIGPSSPGAIVPGKLLLGTYPVEFYTPGPVGIVSRSGTLTYEIALSLTEADLGQSICVGIGSDPIVGSSFDQWLQILEEDDRTEAIVLVGEIGGNSEETAAAYAAEAIDKPIVAYVAGCHAPKGRRLCHAGAIVAARRLSLANDSRAPWLEAEVGTAQSKIEAFERAGIAVAREPSQIPDLVRQAIANRPASDSDD